MAQTTHITINPGGGNTHTGNIAGTFNRTIHRSDEDAQIMRWLSPLEPQDRHQSIRADRFDGVGDWLLETREFREWREGEGGADTAVLFCSGRPGVGKTFLSSLVIDSLCEQEGIIVAGLYCDFLSHKDQTTASMVGAILKQLIGRGEIPKYVRQAFHRGMNELGVRELRLPDVMEVLRSALASLPQVFICIDALDEFLPKHLPEFMVSLGDVVLEFQRTRIFLTGRLHIEEDIQRYFTKVVVIPISPKIDDIRSYLKIRLDEDTDPEAMDDNLRSDIMRIIPERISGIFLLVSINIDAVLGEVTIRQRRKKLDEMTRGGGLGDAYTATLTRLKAQKGNRSILGLKVLMWVLYSERPLQAKELCSAMGVEVGSADLDVENVPAFRTLLASCLGLVTVDASSSAVRLVHFTLQEYLLRDCTLFHSPHSAIAEVCLTYLNFRSVRELSPTLLLAPPTMPFLEYASYYWGVHTRRNMTENVKTLALRLLHGFGEHISAQLILLRYNQDRGRGPYFNGMGGPTGFTGLHGAAFLGIEDVVAALLEVKGWDVNATDCMGSTALLWAAVWGHEVVVRVLLDQEDVNPNTVDTKYGQTPLSWAAEYGHEGTVKILLEQADVNPDQADTKYGQTPLSRAAERGHQRIVKFLLERADVNPDRADTYYGRTPLSWAAEHGHGEVVKILLAREDVNPNMAAARYGQTPLSWAARRGHQVVVNILLEREGVNPDQADTKYGQTPLSWAAKRGHEGVVKILLGRADVDPDRADTRYRQTPISWAAKHGREGVVRMLLERDDVNPNTLDTRYGQTPLSWAAEGGHEGVVKLLLERDDVNPDLADNKYGRTPLWWATLCGNEGVVRMLLERGDVTPIRRIPHLAGNLSRAPPSKGKR